MVETKWEPPDPKSCDVIATAADFRKDAIEDVFAALEAGEPQKLRLPKRGRVVLLRHPGHFADDLLELYRELWELEKSETEQNKQVSPVDRKHEHTIAFAD